MSDSSIDVFLSLNDVLLNKRIDSGYAEPLDELFDKVGFNIKEIMMMPLSKDRRMVIIIVFRQRR